MDLSLARLRRPAAVGVLGSAACSSRFGGSPMSGDFCPNIDDWRRLMSQYGGALAPPIIEPARTVGYGGFFFGVESWLTGIDSDESYWRLGTEGDETADFAEGNRSVDDVLAWTRFSIRKGFPFGFEIGGSLGRMVNSDSWSLGLEAKWALLEGFRTGIGALPDVAVRGAVQTLVGDPEVNVTVPSLDLILSKPIPIAGTMTLTPILAGQLYWIFADSDLVDLTPEVDAFAECRPMPGVPSTDMGAVPCTGSGRDFNNNWVFPEVRAMRARLAAGLQGRYEMLTLAATFMVDIAEPGDVDDDVPDDLPQQWTVNASAGLQY